MPKKASGKPKVKRVEHPQSNGDIYIYEVTTLYNPEKRYNEHVSSKLLGKKSPDGTEILPTRPRKKSSLLQGSGWPARISQSGGSRNGRLAIPFLTGKGFPRMPVIP